MNAAKLPGPLELLPGLPNAVIDLQTNEGLALANGEWRYSDTTVTEIDFVDVGPDLGPSGASNRTYDVVPHAEGTDFEDSNWRVLSPGDTELRLSIERVCFNWYRINVPIPHKVGDFDPTGATVVIEVAVDDYAEIWVNGQLPLALGQTAGQVVGWWLQYAQSCGIGAECPARATVPDCRLWHQRPHLCFSTQLYLDAHGHPRLLSCRSRVCRMGSGAGRREDRSRAR